MCLWTDKLREDRREEADKILTDAAVSGRGLADLAGLFAEMYERSRAQEPDRDKEESFEDRALRLVTTLGGAGVLHGELTPECAAAVQAVLDALSAPADAEDTRTQEQRCHDALGEAMRGWGVWPGPEVLGKELRHDVCPVLAAKSMSTVMISVSSQRPGVGGTEALMTSLRPSHGAARTGRESAGTVRSPVTKSKGVAGCWRRR